MTWWFQSSTKQRGLAGMNAAQQEGRRPPKHPDTVQSSRVAYWPQIPGLEGQISPCSRRLGTGSLGGWPPRLPLCRRRHLGLCRSRWSMADGQPSDGMPWLPESRIRDESHEGEAPSVCDGWAFPALGPPRAWLAGLAWLARLVVHTSTTAAWIHADRPPRPRFRSPRFSRTHMLQPLFQSPPSPLRIPESADLRDRRSHNRWCGNPRGRGRNKEN